MHQAMKFELIEARPITGALGAEISGVNVSQLMSCAIADEIRAALEQHLVIFFRDQSLSLDQMHLAINDYDGHRRSMFRTSTAGEVPVGPDVG
jgi:alpha-ketoglutarate-dependent taurine dioxygenase